MHAFQGFFLHSGIRVCQHSYIILHDVQFLQKGVHSRRRTFFTDIAEEYAYLSLNFFLIALEKFQNLGDYIFIAYDSFNMFLVSVDNIRKYPTSLNSDNFPRETEQLIKNLHDTFLS
jgi:hypothetical protein